MSQAPALVAVLSARVDQLQTDFDKATSMAGDAVAKIEGDFAAANPSINLSGMTAFVAGIGSAAVGAYALLDVLGKVNAEVADIARAAQVLNTSTDNFQALRFALTTSGVSGEQAGKDLEKVAGLLADAQRNENSLSKLLDANNIAYKDRAGQLISINDLIGKGAGLIQNAASYADKVQIAKMLGFSPEAVSALENGAAAFKEIADGAQQAGVIIDRETIAKAQNFDEAWKRSSAVLSAQFKSAFADVAGYADDLIDKLNAWIAAHAPAQSGAASGEAKFDATLSALAILGKEALGLEQNYNQVTAALERMQAKGGGDPETIRWLQELQRAAKEAADAEERLATINASLGQLQYEDSGSPLPRKRPNTAPRDPSKIPARKTDDSDDAYDTQESAIKRRTDEYVAQTAAIGLNAQAKTELKAKADLLHAADKADLEITPALRAEIDQLASAEGRAAQAYADAAQKFKQQNELIQFGGDQLISIMDGVRNGALTGAQAVKQLENAFINAAEKALLLGTGPLAGLFGTAAAAGTGGTGGLFGALFGGARGGGDTGGGFAAGGWTGSGSPSTPAGVVHGSEYVFDADSTRRIGVSNLEALRRGLRGYQQGGFVGSVSMPAAASAGGERYVFAPVTHIDASGASMSPDQFKKILAANNERQRAQWQRDQETRRGRMQKYGH